MEDPDPGMASCYCREAVNSLVNKLTQLMEHRPVIRCLLQGLAIDELFQVWKMVLEMACGIQDWTDTKLATSTNLVESEAGRRQIREIQARIREARGRCRSYYDDAPHSADGSADQQHDDRGQEKTAGAAAVVGVGDSEDRVHDAGAAMMNSSVVAARDSLETLSIRFGALPIFMMKQCVVDGGNYNLGAGSLSSSKLVFLGANLLRNKEMRATRPKRFIQIGSMQVELPT